MYYDIEDRGCSCHLGHPPCSYCTDVCHDCKTYFDEDEGCHCTFPDGEPKEFEVVDKESF